MRTSQSRPEKTLEAGFQRWFLWLPAFLRHPFLPYHPAFSPIYCENIPSPVTVTAVGMFGNGSALGYPHGQLYSHRDPGNHRQENRVS